MSHDYAVTDGHALLSLHRYLEDVRHMVIFDDLVEYGHHRVRLYLPDAAFQLLKQAESKGIVKIVHHEEIINSLYTEARRSRASPSRTRNPQAQGQIILF